MSSRKNAETDHIEDKPDHIDKMTDAEVTEELQNLNEVIPEKKVVPLHD